MTCAGCGKEHGSVKALELCLTKSLESERAQTRKLREQRDHIRRAAPDLLKRIAALLADQ